MGILAEPIPIQPGDTQAEYYYNEQLRELFLASQNLSLISRSTAIQDGDKVGNLDAKYIVFTSNGTADTEDAKAHRLGRTPRGYIVVSQDKAAHLYRSQSSLGDTTYIYWKSSAASVAWVVMVF